ncbi:MAG: DUF4330 family protein, partial [Haloarculaceae archaeon]
NDAGARTVERNAVVAFETGPDAADSLSAGDRLPLANRNGMVTVRDLYQTRMPNGSVRTVASVTARVTTTGEWQLATGDELSAVVDGYDVTGIVRRRLDAPTDLDTRRQSVLLDASIPTAVATRVDAGDELVLGGRTLARVTSVTTIPTADEGGREHVRLGARMWVRSVDGQFRYANRTVAVGRRLAVPTEHYRVRGTVVNATGNGVPGRPVDATLTVAWTDVRPAIADGVAAGTSETHPGATATITDVATEPAQVLVTSSDGHLYLRDHPSRTDVTLTVRARVYRRHDRLYFHARPLRTGDDVTLRFGTTVVEGTLVDVETNAASGR